MYTLICPRPLNPHWFNSVKNGAQGVAINATTIECQDVRLSVTSPSEIALYAGQVVHVKLQRDFVFETEEERQEQKRLLQEQREANEQEQRIKAKRDREEAIVFNASLNIPVNWVSGIKIVLSGLLENSMCNGTNRATVEHILLQEELHEGRLHRRKDDFLCTSSSSDNGKRWTEPHVDALDINGEVCQYKVTCKQCLRIASKWQSK